MTENKFKDDLNIGYQDNNDTMAGRIKRYCMENGADEHIITWMLNLDYDRFITKLKCYMASANEDSLLSEEDLDVINSYYRRDDYQHNVESVLETLKLYEGDESLNDDDDYVFPTREILNGNFPKMNKEKLTEEIKYSLNVHNLLDVEYDVFIDQENGTMIPVYYNIATHNIKWFNFCTYLNKLYTALGVKANPMLPLITFDRDLLGLDLLDENNTNEFNGKVVAECEKNIIFAVRECARFHSSTGKKERTELSLGDWTWMWLYAQCFNTYREAPRQTGKTFLVTLIFGVEFAISYSGLMALIVHFKSSEAIKNRNKMLDFSNALPTYLKTHNIKAKIVKGERKLSLGPDVVGGGSQKTENIFKKNILKTVAVGKTESTAEQAGRGDTAHLISADEINFISQITALLTALTFAHSTARTLARKAGKRYGMHFTSTAGKLHTRHGKEMHKLIYNKMCMFQAELFEYNLQDLEIYLKKNSEINFFVIKYDYDELGYTEEWLDERISNSKGVEDILVEIFQKWLSLDDTSLFKLDVIRRLEMLVKRCIERNFMYKKNNIIKYYPSNSNLSFEEVIRGLRGMAWGIDSSSGGGDYSVVYAIDLHTLKPVFIYKTNNLVITDFAIIVMDLMRYVKELNPTMTFVVNPEQNGPGLSLIPLLLKEKDLEPHVFRTVEYYDSRKSSDVIRGWHRQFSSDVYFNYGTNMKKRTTDGRSMRDLMFETILFEVMDKYPYALSNADAMSEVLTLHRKSGKIDGKIEAKSGFHDDVVCAALHCLAVPLYEYNRQMLMRFWNYTVDTSRIVNMAINSHIDNLNDSDTAFNLSNKFDYEIRDMQLVTGAEYQILKIFKYVDGVRMEIRDPEERDKAIQSDEKLREVNMGLKRLTHSDVKTYMTHEKTSPKGKVNMNNMLLHNQRNSNSTSDNRTNSSSYLNQNKFNTKAKMF
ncbi:MAG: hypothetical protein ACRCX2_36385 [Paraclostridium sp.]